MDNEQLLKTRQVIQSKERAIDPTQFKKSFLDIQYTGDSPQQRLDVFLPEAEGVWPLIVFVHGGGWFFGGRREECISFVFKFVSQGYAVATVDYRLVPESTFPGSIHDVKAAIRYLRAHAEELQLNTDKIVVCGNSAGGHLAALAAVKGDFPLLDDLSMGNAEYSSEVDGLISWYGVFDMEHHRKQVLELYPEKANEDDPNIPMFLGTTFDADDWAEKSHAASAINYVTPDYPPTLIQQGLADRIVPYTQAKEFYQKICEVCGPDRATVEYFPDAGHAAPVIKANENLLRCLKFLDSIYYPDGNIPYERPELPELQFVETAGTATDPFEKQ